MKRDFQEEYQNYIESDMPDLWSRIEPNLKEKAGMPEGEEKQEKEKKQESAGGQEKNGQEKVIYFMKRAVPAAACLCALVIGIGVMGISKKNSAEMPMEAACAGPPEAEMSYDAEPEAMAETTAEEEAVMWDESYDDGAAAMEESAAPSEAPTQGAEENADMDESPAARPQTDNTAYQDSKEGTNVNKIEASEEAVTVERAVLSGIAVASEEMQEEGYAYAYTFRLEDNTRLIVYLTNEQCKDLENREVEIKRQAAYTLSVFPVKSGENSGDTTVGESFLENLEKLP